MKEKLNKTIYFSDSSGSHSPFKMVGKEFFNLGKNFKISGLFGELVFFFDEGLESLFTDIEFLFVDVPGDPVPFRIESVEISGNSARIKLKDINNIIQAKQLLGYNLLVEIKSDLNQKKRILRKKNLKGYTVIDQNKGEIGIVLTLTDLRTNIIVEIQSGNNIILIPFVEEIIVEIDSKQKVLRIDAPDGLIDMYINK